MRCLMNRFGWEISQMWNNVLSYGVDSNEIFESVYYARISSYKVLFPFYIDSNNLVKSFR